MTNRTPLSSIVSFQLTRLDKQTLDCFSKLDYTAIERKIDIERKYNELNGYNPSSDLKNKQQCQICQQFGYSCMGHPVRIDVKHDFISPFAKSIITVLSKVFCFSCGRTVIPNIEKISVFAFAKTVKKDQFDLHSSSRNNSCKAFIYMKEPDTIEFLRKLNEEDLASFGLSKTSIVNLVNREILLLPMALQTSDDRLRNVHMKYHLQLIDLLKTTSDLKMEQVPTIQRVKGKRGNKADAKKTVMVPAIDRFRGIMENYSLPKQMSVLLTFKCVKVKKGCFEEQHSARERGTPLVPSSLHSQLSVAVMIPVISVVAIWVS